MSVTYDDIAAARDRIAAVVDVTPCPRSDALSELTGCRIYCKLDYLQQTGSFKERGGANALMQLDKAQRARGVIAASAGNHALALACHGRRLGIAVTVVMPRFSPLIKVATCRRYGAHVVLHGDDFDAARAHALQRRDRDGLTYIHGFDDPAIIAGQGTLALEVLEQVPDVEAIIIPIGGGGLIAGASLAIKHLRPDVEVIGVEAANAANYAAAVAAGKPVRIDVRPTLADGLAVGKVGELAFEIAQQHVNRTVTVEENQLALAILRLLEMEKSVVEGAAASALAALLAGKLPELGGRHVVLALCGGNIDPALLGRVIEHGMVVDGRLCRFTATISDRPGGLERFAHVVAEQGASIKHIVHDRAFSGPDVSTVRVACIAETSDHEHARRLYAALDEAGYDVREASV